MVFGVLISVSTQCGIICMVTGLVFRPSLSLDNSEDQNSTTRASSLINDGDKLIRYLSTQLLGASKLGSRVSTLEISILTA